MFKIIKDKDLIKFHIGESLVFQTKDEKKAKELEEIYYRFSKDRPESLLKAKSMVDGFNQMRNLVLNRAAKSVKNNFKR